MAAITTTGNNCCANDCSCGCNNQNNPNVPVPGSGVQHEMRITALEKAVSDLRKTISETKYIDYMNEKPNETPTNLAEGGLIVTGVNVGS